ncbi:hypothetical protein [Aquiflexum sp.]|uniref:hypothetical protein n=1 Tax=Aquiflexum sp. TaxID=1872584 RepID=UPI0035943449
MNKGLLVISICLLFFQCDFGKDSLPANSQLLRNIDISLSPDSVTPWAPVANEGFSLGVSQETFLSGNRSLFIENQDSLNINAALWRQTYDGPMPAEGRRLTLRAHLKGENIELKSPGSNIYISIRMFPVEDSEGTTINRFLSSQNRFRVFGTFDWEPLAITLPSFPKDVEYITVYMVMGPKTIGKVYFDDITLTVE